MRKKDTLYSVTKWNMPLFMPRKDSLFDLGGGMDDTNFNIQALYQQAASYNPYQGFYDINNNPTVNDIWSSPYPQYENIGETLYRQHQMDTGNFNYIVPSDALAKSKVISQGITNKAKPVRTSTPKTSTGNSINWGNVGKTAAGIASLIPESEMTIGGTTFKRGLWDAADPTSYLANGRESDTGNALSDLGVAVTKGSLASGQWYGALLGAGLKVAGSIANAGWGIKGNKENIAKIEKSTDKANQIGNILGQASTNEDILALSGRMSNGSGITDWNDLYENGRFTNKGTRKGNELINKEKNALGYQNRALLDATSNVAKAYNNAILAHYSAYGGPLYNLAMNNNNDMGAIEYGFMSDYLASKKAKEQNQGVSGNLFAGMPGSMFGDGGNIHIKPSHRGRLTELKARTGKTEEELYNDGNPAHRKMVVFARNARRWKHGMGGLLNLYAEDDAPLFAFGGDLNTHGSDFSTGLTHIDTGGTHEENPNQGVPMGVDPQGNPNLVEEGEVIYDNYVFSNRIFLDDEAKKKLGLKGKDELSYANAAKKLEKIVNERPNDPISKETFKVQMGILREEQERQKKTMEAEKAQEVFNAMSPEEQTAVIENAAQQSIPAEQQIPPVPSMEQMAMEQGNELNPDNISALGGEINKFDLGGIKPYGYSTDWTGFDYFNPQTGEYDPEYIKFLQDKLNQDWVKRILSGQYGNMDRYLAKNKGYAITPEQVATLASDKKYSDMHKAAAAAYKEYLEGIDPVTGKKAEEKSTTPSNTEPSAVSSSEEKNINKDNEDEEGNKQTPKNRWEGWRYAGLAGPVIGLGMMSAGIGKPNYKDLDAVLEASKEGPILAQYRPFGSYMKYTPMDIYTAQNRMNAQARATDRAIMNGTNPGRYAGLIASGYNSQLASGELFRQALAYNNEQRQRVAEFKRGTEQANADAAMRTSQFNADAINRDRQYRNSLAMNVAQQKLEGDASWYNSLYGNVNQLFKGASELGRENALWNMISALGADTVNFGDSNTGNLFLDKNNRKRTNKNSGITTIG